MHPDLADLVAESLILVDEVEGRLKGLEAIAASLDKQCRELEDAIDGADHALDEAWNCYGPQMDDWPADIRQMTREIQADRDRLADEVQQAQKEWRAVEGVIERFREVAG